MLRKISFSVISLCLAGCMAKGKMAATISLNPAKEVIFKIENGQGKSITDPEKIEGIIRILHGAKRTIVKFIPREEILIRREDGSVVTILKSGEYMRMEGGMFKLSGRKNRRLSELLTRR